MTTHIRVSDKTKLRLQRLSRKFQKARGHFVPLGTVVELLLVTQAKADRLAQEEKR